MKINIKSALFGAVVSLTLVGGIVFASTEARNLWAEFADVQIYIDGQVLVPKGVNGTVVEPFIVDGTTYVPIRAISQAYGKDVQWDGVNKKVIITEPITSYDQVLTSFGGGFVNSDGSVPDLDIDYKYAETDLNGDGVKELLISYGANNSVERCVMALYTKLEGKVKQLPWSWGTPTQTYPLSNNIFVTHGTGTHRWDTFTEYSILKDGEFEIIAEKRYRTLNEGQTWNEYYKINGTEVDEEAFNTFVSDYDNYSSKSATFLETMNWTAIDK